MNNYLDMYVKHFDLKMITNIHNEDLLYDRDGNFVAFINKDDPGTFNYINRNFGVTQCKVSDLILCILNNIPTHG